MQVIPADWQSKIELHIVTMKNAMAHATQVGPGEEHSRRWHLYEGTCEEFLDYTRSVFGSTGGFDEFMKSQTREAYRLCGQDDIPEGYWHDHAEGSLAWNEAQNLAGQYTHAYKGQITNLGETYKRELAREARAGGNNLQAYNIIAP